MNGVAVGEGTYHATGRVFEYAQLEAISAKGKSEPMQVWQALKPTARLRLGRDPFDDDAAITFRPQSES